MLSSSVTVIFPFSAHAIPVRASILMNSQPKAPAPIKSNEDFLAVSTNLSPNNKL